MSDEEVEMRSSSGSSNGSNGTAQGTFQLAVLEKLETLTSKVGTVEAKVDALVLSDKQQNIRIAKQGKLITKANAIRGTIVAVSSGLVLGLYELAQKLGH